MFSYFAYPSFPLIGVVGVMSLVINLQVASGSEDQMFAPHGGDRPKGLVTLKVT